MFRMYKRNRENVWRITSFIGKLLLPDRWIHNDKIGVDKLRRRLQLTERIIKHILRNDEYLRLKYLSRFNSYLLDELVSNRRYILNRMFLLGCSDAEVEGFKRVNDNLHSLHLQMYERARELWRRELSFEINEDFDDDIELDGEIIFTFNDAESSLVKYDNDGWYGSDFAYMIELEYELMRKGWNEIVYCGSHRGLESSPEMTDEQLGLDLCLMDDTSWDDGIIWFCKNPKLKDIFIHYPMHDLVDHKDLSIADVVRMNDFWCEVRVKHQKIIDQYGRHENLIRKHGRG